MDFNRIKCEVLHWEIEYKEKMMASPLIAIDIQN